MSRLMPTIAMSAIAIPMISMTYRRVGSAVNAPHQPGKRKASRWMLTMVTMPLTLSIADGIGLGFASHALLRLASGRAREVSPLVYLFSALFVVRFALS